MPSGPFVSVPKAIAIYDTHSHRRVGPFPWKPNQNEKVARVVKKIRTISVNAWRAEATIPTFKRSITAPNSPTIGPRS